MSDLTLDQRRQQLANGEISSVELMHYYWQRMDQLNAVGPQLGAVLERNDDVWPEAEQLDRERTVGQRRGPLHGLPILVKDNIATQAPLHTSAGSLALAEWLAPEDATVVTKLRAAGALILGKTNLSEWANFRCSRSVSGWSSRGGQTRNPYALDRTPWGSSSGSAVAVAADLCAGALGTETDGSVVYPAAMNSIVGLKPTVGLVSRAGVIPLSHSQDTVGPMGRSVEDVALLLDAIAGVDSTDPATAACQPPSSYRDYLQGAPLRGARLGVARQFCDQVEAIDGVFENALVALREAGALLVDPVDLGDLHSLREAEMTLLYHEFNADLNAFLATLPSQIPVHSLQELIALHDQQPERYMPYFGQDRFRRAEACGPLASREYQDALASCRHLSRESGIDRLLAQHQLDAVIAPTADLPWKIDFISGDHAAAGAATPAAVAGYPHLSVPMGYHWGLPLGLSFFGGRWQEGKLLGYGWDFQQKTQVRRAPGFLASVDP